MHLTPSLTFNISIHRRTGSGAGFGAFKRQTFLADIARTRRPSISMSVAPSLRSTPPKHLMLKQHAYVWWNVGRRHWPRVQHRPCAATKHARLQGLH